MRQIKLRRLNKPAVEYATFGQLVPEDEQLIAVTLEHPWVDENHDQISDRKVSRVPAGIYHCVLRRNADTRHDYDVYELEDVPGRDNVQLHIGNLPEHTDGCILVGSAYGPVMSKKLGRELMGVTGSTNAYEKWMAEMGAWRGPDGKLQRDEHGSYVGNLVKEFTLTVLDAPLLA